MKYMSAKLYERMKKAVFGDDFMYKGKYYRKSHQHQKYFEAIEIDRYGGIGIDNVFHKFGAK